MNVAITELEKGILESPVEQPRIDISALLSEKEKEIASRAQAIHDQFIPFYSNRLQEIADLEQLTGMDTAHPLYSEHTEAFRHLLRDLQSRAINSFFDPDTALKVWDLFLGTRVSPELLKDVKQNATGDKYLASWSALADTVNFAIEATTNPPFNLDMHSANGVLTYQQGYLHLLGLNNIGTAPESVAYLSPDNLHIATYNLPKLGNNMKGIKVVIGPQGARHFRSKAARGNHLDRLVDLDPKFEGVDFGHYSSSGERPDVKPILEAQGLGLGDLAPYIGGELQIYKGEVTSGQVSSRQLDSERTKHDIQLPEAQLMNLLAIFIGSIAPEMFARGENMNFSGLTLKKHRDGSFVPIIRQGRPLEYEEANRLVQDTSLAYAEQRSLRDYQQAA